MKKIILIMLCVMVCNANLWSQQNPPNDPMGKAFFPPDLVMQKQDAIGLTEAQRNSISKEMQSAQSEFMNLQWELAKETEKFKSLIEKEKPAEASVSEQLDRMLAIENKIKKRQITLLIRIKNLLTPEQQEQLQQLKGK